MSRITIASKMLVAVSLVSVFAACGATQTSQRAKTPAAKASSAAPSNAANLSTTSNTTAKAVDGDDDAVTNNTVMDPNALVPATPAVIDPATVIPAKPTVNPVVAVIGQNSQKPVVTPDKPVVTPDKPIVPPAPPTGPCKYNNPLSPTFVITKNMFGPGVPPMDVPNSIVKGGIQPDGKTYVGGFTLFYSQLNKTWITEWNGVDAGWFPSDYAVAITNSSTSDCQLMVAFVKQDPRTLGGCFAVTSMIRMANGSDKLAAFITVGDELFNPLTRTSSRVKEVVAGPEADKSMYQVQVGSNKVLVTEKHPFLTRTGLKKANELVVGDAVVTSEGGYDLITAIEVLAPNASQRVVNFVLDSGADAESHMVLADGVVTGDLFLQRQLQAVQ